MSPVYLKAYGYYLVWQTLAIIVSIFLVAAILILTLHTGVLNEGDDFLSSHDVYDAVGGVLHEVHGQEVDELQIM